ncbi:MAG: Polymer-forming cytoskeletal [Pedosphaera sp.]|nr:Polymer-forming cytoskeletal [Pedosphaera sp.]
MAASKQDKVLVACPHCGHAQPEPRTAISTICKGCRGHYQVQEALKPTRKAVETGPEKRRITCFECGAELDVPISAQSTMCKKCSRYVDLNDYHIANTVSKNFKTKGTFTLEQSGYVFNTETMAGEAVIKGRFLGKLVTERSLTIYSSAEIKGSFKAGRLIIPAANRFHWKDPLKVGSAEIAGELVANLQSEGTVILKSTARLFGDVEAKNLVVEEGAVVVGSMRVGGAGA